MENIRLLDCTLRDGGYINQWGFGEKTIRSIASRLTELYLGQRQNSVSIYKEIEENPSCQFKQHQICGHGPP